MRYEHIAILSAVAFISIIAYASASCSTYTSESSCKSASCFWCNRCSSNIPNVFNQINNYGADRCISSSVDCAYSCSTFCGAECQSNTDCKTNLTDKTCYYSGRCSVCSCSYQSTDCYKNGTVIDLNGERVCYYGARYCTSTGCSVNKCALQGDHVCDPDNGCVSATDGIVEQKCEGNDLVTEKVDYFCTGSNGAFSAVQCNATKSTTLEKCKNGCNNGKCRDELCNIAGVITDCNVYDGYYGGRYCKGNDTYESHRDYRCESNKCVYTNSEVKQSSCEECFEGRCVDSISSETTSATSGTRGTINNTQYNTQPTGPPMSTAIVHGGRLYNGFFFGSNQIDINVPSTGSIKFKVPRANGIGTLTIEDGGQIIFSTKSAGSFSVFFAGLGNRQLRMYTTSSGWLFFVPAVYDVGDVTVS